MSDEFDAAACGLVLTGSDGAVIRANTLFASLSGLSQEQLSTRRFSELLDAGSRLFFETRCLPVLQLNGAVQEVSLALARPGAQALPVLVNLSLGLDGDERVIRIAVFDSTQRRDYERQLLEAQRSAEASASRVQALQDASSTFGSAETALDLATGMDRIVRQAFAAPHVAVSLTNSGELSRPMAGASPLDDRRFAGARAAEMRALQEHRIVALPTVAAAREFDPGLADAMIAGRVESVVAVPLLHENVDLGVVSVFFGRQRTIDDRATELLSALARQATLSLGRIRLQQQLLQLALYDPLTGLANRKLLSERLSRVVAASVNDSSPFAAIFLDLDGFKTVNDTLGHPVGDFVLQEVGVRLRAAVRDEDTIGRLGGDEFVIVCERTDSTESGAIARRILSALREPFASLGDLSISASLGVATGVATPQSTITHILGIADVAMYESKRSGRDRITSVTF